ncbi:MAG: endonuclease/exonuclease/phosphatase family protein [Kouleothrix sp.]
MPSATSGRPRPRGGGERERERERGGGEYSWWSQVTNARERNIGWRLDYFLVSPNLVPYIIDADIHADITGSDHCPVSLTLALPEPSE